MNTCEVKVTVVMPIYNAYDYLRPAMDAVLDQTLRDIEVICIDDGSTDHSLEIIKEYQKADERVRIVTENNAGPSTARNKGIIRARGEYMIFLDADDFFEPNLLELLCERADRDSLDITLAGFDIYNNKKAKFSPSIDEDHGNIFAGGAVVSKNEFPHYILQSSSGYVWNKLFRTSFIKDKELMFAPELYVFEDVHFVSASISLAERIGKVDNILIHHRIYSEQSRAKLFRKYYSQVPVVYLKIKEFLMQHGMYIPLMRSYLNLSASRCYKIYNLLWSDAKADFWNILHDGYADSLGWYQHEQSDFENGDVYDFAANVGLYTYAQYTKRLDKGRKLNIEGLRANILNRKIKTAKKKTRKRERIAKFFGRIFKRKKKNKSENDN